MGRDETRAKIQGAIDHLNANPTEARYSDSHATGRLDDLDGLMVHVEGPDGAHITTDRPASLGGTHMTASPGWFLRAAEASCVATLIAMRAAHRGVTLEALEVTGLSEPPMTSSTSSSTGRSSTARLPTRCAGRSP